jgi:hypothetical protein
LSKIINGHESHCWPAIHVGKKMNLAPSIQTICYLGSMQLITIQKGSQGRQDGAALATRRLQATRIGKFGRALPLSNLGFDRKLGWKGRNILIAHLDEHLGKGVVAGFNV